MGKKVNKRRGGIACQRHCRMPLAWQWLPVCGLFGCGTPVVGLSVAALAARTAPKWHCAGAAVPFVYLFGFLQFYL